MKPTPTIFKIPVGLDEVLHVVSLPRGSKILSVHDQRGCHCVWAHVPDPSATLDQYHFEWIGTGHLAPETYEQFIGTALVMEGALVFHLFLVQIEE